MPSIEDARTCRQRLRSRQTQRPCSLMSKSCNSPKAARTRGSASLAHTIGREVVEPGKGASEFVRVMLIGGVPL